MAEAVLARVKKGEDFAELARAHSDDSSAKKTGGNLGTFDRNTMAESFSKAAFNLKIGEVSDVVESPFGFHVIQRHPEPQPK
jgi:parvulin-like peptidyl-prolyl isomerase